MKENWGTDEDRKALQKLFEIFWREELREAEEAVGEMTASAIPEDFGKGCDDPGPERKQ